LKILIIGIVTLLACSNLAIGQSEEVESDVSEQYELEIPDTFFRYTPELIVTTGLNEVIEGEILDSFADPKGYLVQSYDESEGLKWWILIRKDSVYIAFNPMEGSQIWSFSSVQIDRADLNGSGNEELVLLWQNTLGHSGWQGGISEDWEGILIWDPDALVRLMDFVDYYRLDTWWTNYREWDPEEDTADNQQGHFAEEDIIGSGEETECDSYAVTFSRGFVEMKRNLCDDDRERAEEELPEIPVLLYKLTDAGLVRVVSEK